MIGDAQDPRLTGMLKAQQTVVERVAAGSEEVRHDLRETSRDIGISVSETDWNERSGDEPFEIVARVETVRGDGAAQDEYPELDIPGPGGWRATVSTVKGTPAEPLFKVKVGDTLWLRVS